VGILLLASIVLIYQKTKIEKTFDQTRAYSILSKMAPSPSKDFTLGKIKSDEEQYIYYDDSGGGTIYSVKGYSREYKALFNDIDSSEYSKLKTQEKTITKGWVMPESTYNGSDFTDTNSYERYYEKNVPGGKVFLVTYYNVNSPYKVFVSDTIPKYYKDPTPTPYPPIETSDKQLPSIPDSFTTSDYAEYQIDVNSKFFDNFNYPTEVKTINNIIPMKCSKVVTADGNNYSLADGQNSETTDESFYKILRSKIYKLDKDYTIYFDICITKDGKQIVQFQNDGENDYGYLMKNGDIKVLVKDNAPSGFMSCLSPIAADQQGNIYYQCGGGDTRSHASIIKVNLKNGTKKTIISCVSGSPGLIVEPSTCSY